LKDETPEKKTGTLEKKKEGKNKGKEKVKEMKQTGKVCVIKRPCMWSGFVTHTKEKEKITFFVFFLWYLSYSSVGWQFVLNLWTGCVTHKKKIFF